ncbi:MAG: hypothetical protein ACKOC5_10030 [Chloroflexota bacterium]
MLPQIDALIQDIAAAAFGDAQHRSQAEAQLERMQRQGWGLYPAVQRLWDGERDPASLLGGLDGDERAILQDVLDLLGPAEEASDEPPLPETLQEALERLPEAVHRAIADRDEQALQAALPQMSEADQALLAGLLQQWVQTSPEIGVDESIFDLSPMLMVFAEAAKGAPGLRDQALEYLDILEEQGWHISAAVVAVLEGERDPEALLVGLDDQEQQILRFLLDQL